MQTSQSTSYKPKSLGPIGTIRNVVTAPARVVTAPFRATKNVANTVTSAAKKLVPKPYDSTPIRKHALDQEHGRKNQYGEEEAPEARSVEEILEAMKQERQAKNSGGSFVQKKINEAKSFAKNRGKVTDFYSGPDPSKTKTLPDKKDTEAEVYDTINGIDKNGDFGLVKGAEQVLSETTPSISAGKTLHSAVDRVEQKAGGLTAKEAIGDVIDSTALGGFSINGVSDELSAIANGGFDKTASQVALAEQAFGKALVDADTTEKVNGRDIVSVAKPKIDADAADFGVIV